MGLFWVNTGLLWGNVGLIWVNVGLFWVDLVGYAARPNVLWGGYD